MSLFAELKRRKVFRVSIAYVAVAWLLLQVAETVLPAYGFDDAAMRLLVAVLAVGLVLALALAWIFEWTPQGVRVTTDKEGEGEGETVAANRAPNTVIAIFITVAAVAAAWLTFRTVEDAPPTDHSIAVLPFSTIGLEQPDSFTDGMHVGVLTRLADVVDLDVISRTSVLLFSNSDQLLPDIAAELGAAWIMRGDVQQAGGQVLVSASLTDAINDRQVWAEDYQRTLTTANIFDIQADISRRIINALHAQLTPDEETRIASTPTDNLEAYRQYQEGRSLMEQRLPDTLMASLGHFKKALELDPEYTLAWTGIAEANAAIFSYSIDTDPAVMVRAQEASAKAFEIDHELAEVWAASAAVRYIERNLPLALEHLERAIKLRPNFAQAHVYRSYYSALLGKDEDALQAGTRGVALDPMNPEAIINYAMPSAISGNGEAALKEAYRVLNLLPEWPTSRMVVGNVYFQLDQYAEAAEALQGVSVPWAGMGAEMMLALSLLELGEDASEVIATIESSNDPYVRAVIMAATGQAEQGWKILDDIESWPDFATFNARHANRDLWNPGGNDVRYVELIRRVDASWGVIE